MSRDEQEFADSMEETMKIDVLNEYIASLNRSVKVRVFLPDSYETSGKRYPVLYMNDGQDVFEDEDAFWESESLRFRQYYKDYGKFVPDIILAAIEAPKDHAVRTAEYSPFTKDFNVPEGKRFESHIEGKGREYLDWVTLELKTKIDALYRTMPGAEYTGICGYSTGGLNSLYAILKYPEVFHRGIAMSAAVCIWMDCLKKVLDDAEYSHIKKLYLDTGTNEYGRMTTKEEFLEGADIVHTYFEKGGLSLNKLKFNIYQDAIHSQRDWRLRFPDALRWIYPEF